MKRQFLLQTNNQNKSSLSFKKIFFLIILLIIVIQIICYSFVSYLKKKTNDEFNEYLDTLQMTEESYEEEIAVLSEYLDEVTLSNTNKGYASNAISVLYGLINDTEESIAYMCKSLYYFEKENENKALVYVAINLSATLINTTAYNMSETILQKALDVELEGDEERYAQIYVYTNLAETLAQRGDYDQALEAIELGESKIEEEDDLEDCEKSLLISRAIAYFGLEQYDECKKIIDDISEELLRENLMSMVSYAIPFYEIASYLALEQGDLELAIEYFEIYVSYCDDYNYSLMRLSYIDQFVEVADQFGFGEEERIIQYENEMIDYYKEAIQDTNEQNAQILLDTYNISLENITIQSEQTMRQFRIYGGISIFFVILAATASLLLHTYKKSQVDYLTGGYNRMKLRSVYRGLIRKKMSFYVIMFDIDNFKMCNDKYGHRFGDEVLRTISQTVIQEIPKMSMFFRYGGEEFVIVCDMASVEIMELSEHIRESVEALTWENGSNITISVGVSKSGTQQDTLKTADECLYKSKKTGKNKVTYSFTEE